MARKKQAFERKTVWVDNTDEAISKRVTWMTRRGWEVVGARATSSSPGRFSISFRKQAN